MVATVDDIYETNAVAALGFAVDELLAMTFNSLPVRELPMLARAVETQVRRLAVFDHALVSEMEHRDVAVSVGARDTAAVLVEALRVTPAEAKARVSAARDLGPRFGFTGGHLPPLFPRVAAAQTSGTISAEHARAIVRETDRLPDAVQAEHCESVELALVDAATNFEPTVVAGIGRHIRANLDPDGTLSSGEDHRRHRDVSLTSRRDGTGRLVGDLTPECTATWQAIFDSLAVPRPATAEGDRDGRSAGQRRHDGLHDAGRRLLTVGDLPDAGGTAVTVLIT